MIRYHLLQYSVGNCKYESESSENNRYKKINNPNRILTIQEQSEKILEKY